MQGQCDQPPSIDGLCLHGTSLAREGQIHVRDKAGFLTRIVKAILTVAAQRRTLTVFHLNALASGLAGHFISYVLVTAFAAVAV